MSVIVEPEAISDHVGEREHAFVMTVGEAGKVKVMDARIDLLGGGVPNKITVELGPGGIRNCNARPAVTLLWPNVSEAMSLLADGTAEPAEVPGEGRGWVTLLITAAVLHQAPST